MSNPMIRPLEQDSTATPGEVVTYQDVVNATALSLLFVVIGAAISWQAPLLMLVGFVVGLVLGLLIPIKGLYRRGLVLAYAAAEGLLLGGISVYLESMYPGVAVQALLATLCVSATILVLHRAGKVRSTPKMTRIFMTLAIAYIAFSLLNLVLMLTGVTDSMFGLRNGWIGVAVGALAIAMASYSLVMDFDEVTEVVEKQMPKSYAWYGAFGLTSTLVWMYIEFIRLLSIIRNMTK